MKHKGYNNLSTSSNIALDYKYNGIELEEALDLNLYEMDMRQYDPAIARWTSIDPVTHYSNSTYNAFDNSPIFWADPSGANSVINWGSQSEEASAIALAELDHDTGSNHSTTKNKANSNKPDDFVSRINRNTTGPAVVTLRDLGETKATGNFSYTFNETTNEYDIIMDFIVSYSQSFRVAGSNGKTIEGENPGLFRAVRGHEELGHVEQYLDAARSFTISGYTVSINGTMATFSGSADQILTDVRNSFLSSTSTVSSGNAIFDLVNDVQNQVHLNNLIQTTFTDLISNHLDAGIRSTVNTGEADANSRAISAGIAPGYLNGTTPIFWQGIQRF